MATGCDKITATTTTAMTRLDDYNGDGEEGGEVKTETTKEPKTKRPTMTTKATKNTIMQ